MYAFQNFANVFIFPALFIVHCGVLPCTWAYTLHYSVHLTPRPTPVLRCDLFIYFCPSAGEGTTQCTFYLFLFCGYYFLPKCRVMLQAMHFLFVFLIIFQFLVLPWEDVAGGDSWSYVCRCLSIPEFSPGTPSQGNRNKTPL